MRAPATEILVSPRLTAPLRLGSIRQAAANFGRDTIVTLPLISALALNALMLRLLICLAALAPIRSPIASFTAPVAFEASEPVTLSFPVNGEESERASWAPLAPIDPRVAVQPMSAFCRICDTGLSALPEKLRAALRSAASRIAPMGMATWARMTELREVCGSGGNSATCRGAGPGGERQSMTFRATKNETATTPIATKMALRRIVSPD